MAGDEKKAALADPKSLTEGFDKFVEEEEAREATATAVTYGVALVVTIGAMMVGRNMGKF